jgi:uncharacterized coiled-coil protein SlyX
MKAAKKKKPHEHSRKQAKLLADLIDKKIDSRVSGLESTVTKMFRLFKKMSKSASPRRIMKLESEIRKTKEMLEDLDVKDLEKDVFGRVEQISRDISKSLEEQRKSIENTEIELSALKKSLDDFQSYEKGFIKMDTANLLRDVESLKTKTQWLELELEKINIRPLMERLDELEARLNSLRISQPMIIE